MPATFLLFLLFAAFALVSPVMLIGTIAAACTNRWRRIGLQAIGIGAALAIAFSGIYLFLNALLNSKTWPDVFAVIIVVGASFTVGTLMRLAWHWINLWRGAHRQP